MRRNLKVFIQPKGSLARRFSPKIQASAVSEVWAMIRFGGKAAALLIGAVACGAAAAALAAPETAGGDITGVWMVQPAYYLGARLSPDPVLTPAALDLRKRRAVATAKGYVRSAGNMLCEGGGGPALSMMRSPFEVMAGFGRISFIFETESFNQPRTVYLKEKTQPDSIFPSENGHSIGHWEGKILVVDTVGFSGRSSLPGGVPASQGAHLVERFSLSKDGKVLTDAITMTDPVSLAQPWTIALKYDRMADTEERFEVSCEPDLDALKTLDLEALKDVDPLVARLIDPNTRPTDPALKIAKPTS
jgi:hypothetical protein